MNNCEYLTDDKMCRQVAMPCPYRESGPIKSPTDPCWWVNEVDKKLMADPDDDDEETMEGLRKIFDGDDENETDKESKHNGSDHTLVDCDSDT
jgi:hypothetical protein